MLSQGHAPLVRAAQKHGFNLRLVEETVLANSARKRAVETIGRTGREPHPACACEPHFLIASVSAFARAGQAGEFGRSRGTSPDQRAADTSNPPGELPPLSDSTA